MNKQQGNKNFKNKKTKLEVLREGILFASIEIR